MGIVLVAGCGYSVPGGVQTYFTTQMLHVIAKQYPETADIRMGPNVVTQ